MSTFEEYFHIVRHPSPAEVEREVNGYRRQGWQLHGFLLQDPRTGEFFQAVKRPRPPMQQQKLAA